MKTIIIFILSFLIYSNASDACSMYKITCDGKTIVGNNEDWYNPNTQIWFEPGTTEEYGVMNVGFIDGFAQGAINEAGLMFDGFGMPYLAVNNSDEKIKTPIGRAVQKIMHSYATVEEVKTYISRIDLSGFVNSMLVFVDKTGSYLIVEGDELIIGHELEQSFSNFYPSKTKSLKDVELDYYQNGLKFINNSEATLSTDYCASVMENLSFNNETQYTTVYDLEKLVIQVYHYKNYDNVVEIDLKEEMKKGAHTLILPELFPKNTEAYQHYLKFNDVQNPTIFIKEAWGKFKADKDAETIKNKKNEFANFLNRIGYDWLYDKGNEKGAIEILKYGVELFPDNANIYDSLGEAFFEDENYPAATKSYKKSLELNPENNNAIEMINKISKEKAKKVKTTLKNILSEKELISKTLMNYIEGSTNGQPKLLEKAFHSDLNLYYVKDGAFKVWSGKDYILDTKEGQATGESGKILAIDFENDAAVAKVEISHPKKSSPYIDYFMLLKVEGEWTIIHKMFTKKSRN